jgi:hypothetical protein
MIKIYKYLKSRSKHLNHLKASHKFTHFTFFILFSFLYITPIFTDLSTEGPLVK